MNKTYVIALAAALFAAPLVYAHTDGNPDGTPKLYCESPGEWNHHDYAAPASGFFLWTFQDGNLEDCDGNGTFPDYDGHSEFAFGGAWLLSCDVACGAVVDPATDIPGSGADDCFGEGAHHPEFPSVLVWDQVLGYGATVYVAADHTDLVDPVTNLNCGDFESDVGSEGTGSVGVTFQSGSDGTYQVYVQGTLGSVTA